MAHRQSLQGLSAAAVFVTSTCAGLVGGCTTDADTSAGAGGAGGHTTTTSVTPTTSSSSDAGGDGGAGGSLACGDFALTAIEWTWHWYDQEAGIYTFSTLLETNGLPDCYNFPGYQEHDKLVFSWDEGESIDIYRSADANWHSGFGPRDYDADGCIIGDIFQSNYVYEGFPGNALLQQLVTSYGPPDAACGHVFNADLIEHVHCAPLADAN